MEVYLIRHGETEFNRQGILQGRTKNGSLNEKGRGQARAFYEAYKDVGFDLVLTSCLKRSYQTVQPFIEEGIRWHALPELDEIGWGIHEGKAYSDWMISNYNKLVESWQKGEYDARIERGESANELAVRVDRFIAFLEKRKEDKVLVCSHGRTIRCILTRVMGDPLSEMEKHDHDNLGLFLFRMNGNQFELKTYNNTRHLKNQN